jgi:hypothetical protein
VPPEVQMPGAGGMLRRWLAVLGMDTSNVDTVCIAGE